jgi:hypothetical protein
VVRFNPWQWSGQNLLLEGFFGEIGDALKCRERQQAVKQQDTSIKRQDAGSAENWRKLGAHFRVVQGISQLTEWAAAGVAAWATLAGRPNLMAGAAAVQAVTKRVEDFSLASEKVADAVKDTQDTQEVIQQQTLAEVREDLKKSLNDMPAPMIVVIDDIDRLTKEQVCMLMQLVKVNADFPNVIYILLFQKDIVARALGTITCEKGQAFLQKIVQIELEVPSAPDHKMREMLSNGMEKIWRRAKLNWNVTQRERWRRLFEEAIWPYFETPRNVKRFLGVFDFYFEAHTDGDILTVNPIDLVLVEILRMFDPEALNVARRAFQEAFIGGGLFDNKEAKAKFVRDINHLLEGRSLQLKTLLYGLFPQASERAQDYSDDESLNRDYRICHKRHFSKYFQLQDNPDNVSVRFIAKFFDEKNNQEECQKLLQQVAVDNKERFLSTLEGLRLKRDDLSPSRMEVLIGAFLGVTDCLPSIKIDLGFKDDAERALVRLAYYFLRGIKDPSFREESYVRIIKNTPALSGPVSFTRALDPRERHNPPSEPIISAKVIERAKKILIPRIWEKAKQPTFWDLRALASIIYSLKEWEGIEPVRKWLAEAIKEPETALKFIRHMLDETIVAGTSIVTKYVLHAQALEKFVDLDVLQTQVQKAHIVDRLDSAALEKLTLALQRKAQGKSYAEAVVLAYDDQGKETKDPWDTVDGFTEIAMDDSLSEPHVVGL